jgi:hypothetical protein
MAKRSRAIQFLVLLVGGPLLAFGGCALFLNTFNVNGGDTNAAQVVGAIGFFAGLVMLAIGVLWGVVVVLMAIFKPGAPRAGDNGTPGTTTPVAPAAPETPVAPDDH